MSSPTMRRAYGRGQTSRDQPIAAARVDRDRGWHAECTALATPIENVAVMCERGTRLSGVEHSGVVIMRGILDVVLALAVGLPCEARAQQGNPTAANLFGIEPGRYPVGFLLIDEHDPSRVVTGGPGAIAQARPIRIHVWYPAARTGQPMRFGRYLAFA